MNPQEQVRIVFDLLKRHLRERGITYRELAKRTYMSEANVKRIFSVRACDLEKLIRFCEAADILFFDLMMEASKTGSSSFRITPELEEFFVKNFDCFVFVREIATARDPNKAIQESKRPREQVRRFLNELEKRGLVSKTRNVYRLRYTGYLALERDSKLRRKIEQEWVPWFMNRTLKKTGREGHSLELFSTGLTEAHRLQLLEDLSLLLQKYREIGITDQRLGIQPYRPVAVCLGIGPYRAGIFDQDIVPGDPL